MGILNRLQNATKGQKIIVTAWLVLSFLWGRSWALSDYDEAMIIIYVPIALVVLSIPTFFLYKIWGRSTNESSDKTKDAFHTVSCTTCGEKVTSQTNFCPNCGESQKAIK